MTSLTVFATHAKFLGVVILPGIALMTLAKFVKQPRNANAGSADTATIYLWQDAHAFFVLSVVKLGPHALAVKNVITSERNVNAVMCADSLPSTGNATAATIVKLYHADAAIDVAK